MKQLIVGLVAIAILGAAPNAEAVTVKEIITLAKVGVSPAEMIKAIERDRTVFRLTIQEILELKKAGVPENVIRYMQKTKKLFGKATTKQPTTTDTPDEMTPEERAALEAKQRAEAEKLAAEARRAEEAQQRAFAQGILKRGMDLANEGQYVESIRTFLDFVQKGGYARGTDEYYTARYGIANALERAGMYQSAANYLRDVLLQGPQKKFFQQAFWKLRRIRKRINYSPRDLEDMQNFTVGQFSKRFQDEFNYVLGEFLYDYGRISKALAYFDAVNEDAPDYAKAQYITGLVQTKNKMYRSAVQSFQRAVTATERNKSTPAVGDLAYLALARIAYEAGQFDAAIFYYRKIPTESNKLATAFYESAWTYFLKGDYSRALGTFQVLHSPYFAHFFYPELWILEATVYVNLCRYKYARQAIKRFNRDVNSLAVPLKQLTSQLRRPVEYYKAMLSIGRGDKKYPIDKRVVLPVMANAEFHNLYKTIKQIQWEESQLRKVQAKLGQFGKDLLATLASLRTSRVIQAGIQVQKVLKKDVEAELAKYAVKVTEIEIDLSTEEIDRKTAELQGRTVDKEKDDSAASEGASAIVGTDSMAWPFEGEYWRDEIGGFRSDLKSQCSKE